MSRASPRGVWQKSKGTKYLVAQPLTAYAWPFEVPTRLRHGLWVRNTPDLPNDNDRFWRWALSGREMENLRGIPWWVTLNCGADSSPLNRRQQRAVEVVKYTGWPGKVAGTRHLMSDYGVRP